MNRFSLTLVAGSLIFTVNNIADAAPKSQLSIQAAPLDISAVQSNNLPIHDPTQPATIANNSEMENSYGLKIDAIMIGKNRKMAIINGQHLQIGDKINKLTVEKIYSDAVKIRDEYNKSAIITIPHSNIKTPVSKTISTIEQSIKSFSIKKGNGNGQTF